MIITIENLANSRGIIRDGRVGMLELKQPVLNSYVSQGDQSRKSHASSTFLAQNPNAPKEHELHNLHPHRLCLKVSTSLRNKHNKQVKHVVDHNISKTVHTHIGRSESQTFFFKFF